MDVQIRGRTHDGAGLVNGAEYAPSTKHVVVFRSAAGSVRGERWVVGSGSGMLPFGVRVFEDLVCGSVNCLFAKT
jgi:hypothetical protein